MEGVGAEALLLDCAAQAAKTVSKPVPVGE